MSQSIQIYNGPGAYSTCVQAWKRELSDSVDKRMYLIEEFNSSYSAGFDRGHVALVLLPDGMSARMFDPLLHLAEKIKGAISSKAAFLGSGASVFLTSGSDQDIYNFNPIPVEVMANEYSKALKVDWLQSSGHFQTDTCRLYDARSSYIFDKIFPKDRHHCRILAECKSRADKMSAIAIRYQPHNASPRLMTTMHPELSYQDVSSDGFASCFKETDSSHTSVLLEKMKDSEILRKEMCRSWFAELGLQLAHV